MQTLGLYSETAGRKLFFKTPPWEHQFRAVEWADDKKQFMLSMDMGTGKTKTTIDVLCNSPAKTVLIVCPKSVIPTWPEEFERHASRPFVALPLNQGSVEERTLAAETFHKAYDDSDVMRIFVINYESAWKEPFFTWASKMMRWDCIVCDESHKIKAASSKVSLNLYGLGKKAQRRICLTGTPFPHSPLDIYGQFRFLNWHWYKMKFTNFKRRYAKLGGFKNYQVLGFQNLEELEQVYAKHAFAVKAEDVQDLPEQQDIRLHVELGAKAKAAYHEMEEEFICLIDEGVVTAKNAMVKLIRLQQITSGNLPYESPYTKDVQYKRIDTAKAERLADLIEGLPNDEPLVVFTQFKSEIVVIRELVNKLRGEGQFAELTGDKDELALFKGGERSVIGVNIKSGGAGIDLTRARYAVYYNLGHSLGDYQQSRKRLHRPGQERNVVYYHLVAKGTVDEKVYAGLEAKKDVVDYIVEELPKRRKEEDYGNVGGHEEAADS